MSHFTVIFLSVVTYFAIGGVILGLIKGDVASGNILYWPGLVIAWLIDLVVDLAVGFNELYYELRREISKEGAI
jgi:hypothetical protein